MAKTLERRLRQTARKRGLDEEQTERFVRSTIARKKKERQRQKRR